MRRRLIINEGWSDNASWTREGRPSGAKELPGVLKLTVFSKTGRRKQAIGSYKQSVLLKPDLAEAHNNLAILYLRRGERGLALEQHSLLKLINYEMAKRLFAVIYRNRIVTH
jgi:tetratricopeptide (TPR) repeat protein